MVLSKVTITLLFFLPFRFPSPSLKPLNSSPGGGGEICCVTDIDKFWVGVRHWRNLGCVTDIWVIVGCVTDKWSGEFHYGGTQKIDPHGSMVVMAISSSGATPPPTLKN